MTREPFAKKISERTGMSERESYAFLNIVIDILREEITNGGEFHMQHFGTLLVRFRKSRYNGVHKIYSKDHWEPFFRPTDTIMEELKKLPTDNVDVTNLGFKRTGRGKRVNKENAREYYLKTFQKKDAEKKA